LARVTQLTSLPEALEQYPAQSITPVSKKLT
jgi:hypothetical protein